MSGGSVWMTGGALYGPADVRYSNAWNNTAPAYVGVSDPTGSDGNLAVDPAFVDTTAANPLDWDVHLAAGSPLSDQGDPTILDLDGSRSDIGAYSGPGAFSD